jgi:hypothetical protein
MVFQAYKKVKATKGSGGIDNMYWQEPKKNRRRTDQNTYTNDEIDETSVIPPYIGKSNRLRSSFFIQFIGQQKFIPYICTENNLKNI